MHETLSESMYYIHSIYIYNSSSIAMLTRRQVALRLIRMNRCSFFWRKKKEEGDEKVRERPEWKGKEEYLKEMQKEREAFEKERREEKVKEETLEQREKREYEVKYGKVDFAKVMIENINIRMTDSFRHPEQLFNFLQNLRVRLSEDNLLNCVASFIELAGQVTEEDLHRPEFRDFLALLANQAGIISSSDNFRLVFQFLDIYCVESQNPIWQTMEILLLKRLNQLDIDTLSQIFSHLGNQREGSDLLWDSSENHIQTLLKNQTHNKAFYAIRFELAYWKLRKGTKPFVEALNKIIHAAMNQGEDLPINSLIQLASIQSSLLDQKVPTIPDNILQLFQLLENQLSLKMPEMNFEQRCLTSQGFGFKFGSEAFRDQLELAVLERDQFSLEELRLVINGFVLNYRASKKLCLKMKEMILQECEQFETVYIANIAKAYYMMEVMEDDDMFYNALERKIVERLKDVKRISIEEIFEVAKSYIITRIGSRELYKLLEIVIKYRFDEIKESIQILGGLHQLYKESGLCSPELIKQFQLNL